MENISHYFRVYEWKNCNNVEYKNDSELDFLAKTLD